MTEATMHYCMGCQKRTTRIEWELTPVIVPKRLDNIPVVGQGQMKIPVHSRDKLTHTPCGFSILGELKGPYFYSED